MDFPNGHIMKTTKATKEALTALDQALADIIQNSEPRREDEFTSGEMHEKLSWLSICVIQRRLRDKVKSGEYAVRSMGRDFLYRKL